MRLFEETESPQKQVKDLQKPLVPPTLKSEDSKATEFNFALKQLSLNKPTNLLKSRKTCAKRRLSVTEILGIDQNIVSYGQFISGQTLGNEVLLTNQSDKEQSFTMMLDKSQKRFPETAKDLLADFNSEDLPFESSMSDQKQAVNSENKFECWSIENPISKTLQKSITCTIAPKETLRLIVVLQTPMTVSCADLFAKLIICHIPDREDSDFGDKYTVKRIGGSRSSLVQKHDETVSRTTSILLCGRLQNPVLVCQKAITSTTLDNIPVIPLAAKISQNVQKFKLPFKAVHPSALETDFEFIFIKSVKPEAGEEDSLEMKQFTVFDCMTFFCLPAVLKVGPDQPALLSVQLQINQEKIQKLPEHLLDLQMTKLLVARIKNTKLIQSFYLTIKLTQ